MCTVTYIPVEDNELLLTHNRDEHYTRGIAILPEKKLFSGHSVLSPTDPDAGGTWIAVSHRFVLCLLNGGFKSHKRQPPYRHSRGMIIPDFFSFVDVEHFLNDYLFDGLEPFTLVIADRQQILLHELVFDGLRIHHRSPDPMQAYIWSATSLYTIQQRITREQYFQRFLDAGLYTRSNIIDFHKNRFEVYEDEGIQINREEMLKTVSLTSIACSNRSVDMHYEDFILGQTKNLSL